MNVTEYKKSFVAGGLLFLGIFAGYLIVQGMTVAQDKIPAINTLSSCETFPKEFSLEEAESMNKSADPCWWLDSGAVFSVHEGIGQTQMGPLYHGSPWRKLYAQSDPVDTGNGSYPQNIFRLVNKVSYQNFYQEVFVNIKSYHAIESPNRNGSNGILLFGRYLNADNLYYAGVRVDGLAVIKRKLNGIYETLGTAQLDNSSDYDRVKNPNVLPVDEWVGVAMETKNITNTDVMIKLYVFFDGAWQAVLAVVDNPTRLPNGKILMKAGNVGIRTDFVDAEFKDYKITSSAL